MLELEDVAHGLQQLHQDPRHIEHRHQPKQKANKHPLHYQAPIHHSEDDHHFQQYVSTESKPAAVVACIMSHMSSSEASQQAGAYATETHSKVMQLLETSLDTAKSCVSVPFVTRSPKSAASVSETITSVFAPGKDRQHVLEFHVDGSSTSADIMAQVDARLAQATEGRPVLVLLRAKDPSAVDVATLKSVMAAVQTSTDNNFISLFSADRAGHSLAVDFGEPSGRHLLAAEGTSHHSSPHKLGASPKAANYTGLQYINAPILSGFALGLIMLLFLWVGVGCMMSIESPKRFANEPLPVPKEY